MLIAAARVVLFHPFDPCDFPISVIFEQFLRLARKEKKHGMYHFAAYIYARCDGFV